MATQTPQPVIHIYKEINGGKHKTVKHYDHIQVKDGSTKLTNLINVSKNQNCAQSMPTYWLKERGAKKWNRNYTTGLFKTSANLIFKGDTDKKKNLVLFKFSDNAKTLTIYLYPNYFTKDLSELIQIIV
jgi:hypothetical protein